MPSARLASVLTIGTRQPSWGPSDSTPRISRTIVSVSGWSDLLTTITSGISITPALSAWIESPEPGISTSTTVSAWSMMSTSAWPTPTVSSRTSSLPLASISSAAWRVASDRPPSEPRLAIERMNTPGSRKWSARRMRSPSSAPWVNGELGSIERTATSRSRSRACSISRPISVDLPTPGGPVKPTTRARPVLRIDLAHERPALGVVVLDQRDRARQRALVAREQALGELGGGLARGGHAAGNASRLRPRYARP